MRSQVLTQRQWQTPIGGGWCGSVPLLGGGFGSVSIGGVNHFRVLRASQAKGTALSPIKLKSSALPNSSTQSVPMSPEIAKPLPLSPIPPLHSLSSSSPPPWLLFPSSYFNHLDHNQDLLDHYPYCFVSPSDNKVFRLDKTQVPSQRILPWDREFCFPDDAEFQGSSPLGWVLVHHPRTLQLFLINPLCPSESIVPLPPVHALDRTLVAGSVSKSCIWSDQLDRKYIFWEEIEESENFGLDLDSNDGKDMHHIVEDKPLFCATFAMSSVPSDPTCTVMLVQNREILQFWKPGHKKWTQVTLPYAYYYGDSIVYSRTSQCFYVLNNYYLDAWKWDSHSPQPQRTLYFEVDDTKCHQHEDCVSLFQYRGKGRHLVESSSGDLLMVSILCNGNSDVKDPPCLRFFVYKMNFDKRKWEHVKSLGDEETALFVGSNCAFCIPVGDHPELKPNCIYYGGDESYSVDLDVMMVFNMEDETIQPYRFISDHNQRRRRRRLESPSVWVLPNPIF